MDQNQNSANVLGDREMLEDFISSQKHLTESYNAFANTCATPNLRDEYMNILKDEHQIEAELLDESLKRGWMQIQQADLQKAAQLKQQYQNAF